MAKRPSSTLALSMWTVLLIGAFAGVARLDHDARTPKISRYDYVAPQIRPPSPRGVADTGPTVAPPPPLPPAPVAEDPRQRAQYDADTRKTIIELQPYRSNETAQLIGIRNGRASLLNLNPNVNSWFLLTLDWDGADARRIYHLENPDPLAQHVHLSDAGLTITTATQSVPCDLTSGRPNALEQAAATKMAYAPLCNGHLYLRNRVAGHYTDLEQMTEFLRENVWKGDDIVGFVKEDLYQDAYRETGETTQGESEGPTLLDAPAPAKVRAADAKTIISARSFGINVQGPPSRQLALGHWYPVEGLDGAFASLMLPQSVDEAIFAGDRGQVNALDSVEASALVHLVAFDLSMFEVKFAMGTDNPRLGWSPRAVMRSDRMPGPDGIDSASPVVTNGIVNPALLNRIAATFAGGFKREHGAFKWGELARVRYSSHYGFIEHGVVFSKLQLGLATLFVLDDGTVHMETWIKDYERLLPHVQFARQNGVPLVELNARTESIPGAFVNNWGAGNWSGSADAKLRTLRAGMCIVQAGNKQYLVHGLFTTATPSAMAVVFQSYGCNYAMLLDMNALEHSYFALYVRQGDRLAVEHPIAGMTDIDRMRSGQLVPRFVGYPDNRDFFYLVRRKGNP